MDNGCFPKRPLCNLYLSRFLRKPKKPCHQSAPPHDSRQNKQKPQCQPRFSRPQGIVAEDKREYQPDTRGQSSDREPTRLHPTHNEAFSRLGGNNIRSPIQGLYSIRDRQSLTTSLASQCDLVGLKLFYPRCQVHTSQLRNRALRGDAFSGEHDLFQQLTLVVGVTISLHMPFAPHR